MSDDIVEELFRGHSILIYNPQDSLSSFQSAISPEAEPSWPENLIKSLPNEETQGDALMIDGKPIPYTKGKDGFYIYYQPVETSLLDAARSYLETQSEVSE